MTHVRIRLEIAKVVIIHNAEPAVAEGLGNGQRNLGFRLDDVSAILLDLGPHFLFQGDGKCPALLGLSLSDPKVRGRLIRLQISPDIGKQSRMPFAT